MTDKEKLQKLFDAALKAPADTSASQPKRSFPSAELDPLPTPPPAPAPLASFDPPIPVSRTADAGTSAPSAALPVLDDAASTELAALLEEQMKRQSRRRRVEALVTAVIFFGSTAGGSIWFVQDPARMQALGECLRDLRSVGDVKSLVAKYQEALDRVAARGKQIDQASTAMGVKKSAEDDKDPYFDKEMKSMMGGEGRTIGDRNSDMRKNFSKMAEKAGGPIKTTAALKKDESFEWKN